MYYVFVSGHIYSKIFKHGINIVILFQLPGSAAEVDGKLQRGDFIVAVDGKDLSSAEFVAICAALKLCNNKTTIKVKRFKIIPR